MAKKLKNNTKQLQELMIVQTAMFYLTLFLEQAGVIKNNLFVKDAEKDFADIKGAISLGKQTMFILSRVKMPLQKKALDKANKIMQNTDNSTDFNYLVFVLALLMEYKEHFKNKIYMLPISFNELNTIFDEYFKIALEDKEQMEVIKDSTTVAENYYKNIINYAT
jgi:hypothetical protein